MNQSLEVWYIGSMIISIIASLSFPIVYSLTPWRKTYLGRSVMALGATLALMMIGTFFAHFWVPATVTQAHLYNAIFYTIVAIVSANMSFYIVVLSAHKEASSQND